jgi:hypothetical protein
LNNSQSHIYDLEYETAMVNGVQYLRDREGTWRYADTWIPVPGARDLTLTERFQPQRVVNAQGEVERLIVSGESIRASPALLDWCLEVGTPMEGPDGELNEVFVPHAKWEERDRVPGALVAPEHSDEEPKRALAEVERRYREADQKLTEVAEERADVLRRYAGRMTREEARKITGLSVGRIQQLIRREKLTDLEVGVLGILDSTDVRSIGTVKELAHQQFPRSDIAAIDRVLRELLSRGLIKGSGSSIQLTREGREAAPPRSSPARPRKPGVKAR